MDPPMHDVFSLSRVLLRKVIFERFRIVSFVNASKHRSARFRPLARETRPFVTRKNFEAKFCQVLLPSLKRGRILCIALVERKENDTVRGERVMRISLELSDVSKDFFSTFISNN